MIVLRRSHRQPVGFMPAPPPPSLASRLLQRGRVLRLGRKRPRS